MKKNTKFISFILILILIVSIATSSVSAALPPLVYGDTNCNGIDVMDATYVQRYVAQLEEHDPYRFIAGDVDGDSELSVFDATLIQKYLVGEIEKFPAGVEDNVYVEIVGIGFSYGPGVPTTKTPVIIKAHTAGGMGPFVYNFYVDNELIAKNTTEDTITYTFKSAGYHEVSCTVTNRAGVCASKYTDIVVGDSLTPDGSLVLLYIYHEPFYGNVGTFHIAAHGGKGEYMVSYTLYEGSYTTPGQYEFVEEIPYVPYKDNYKFTTDYNFIPGKQYSLFVSVMDENGDVVSDVLEFDYMLPPPA